MAARKKGSRRVAPRLDERRLIELLERVAQGQKAVIEAIHAAEGRLRRDFEIAFTASENAERLHAQAMAEQLKTFEGVCAVTADRLPSERGFRVRQLQ